MNYHSFITAVGTVTVYGTEDFYHEGPVLFTGELCDVEGNLPRLNNWYKASLLAPGAKEPVDGQIIMSMHGVRFHSDTYPPMIDEDDHSLYPSVRRIALDASS